MRQANLRAGETDNLPPGRERILHLRLAFIYMGSLSESRKIYASPGPEGSKKKGKRNEFVIMEDALTLVLVIVLCLLLKPLISAILRGMGSSEHRRDR